jgi:hypothetical protein
MQVQIRLRLRPDRAAAALIPLMLVGCAGPLDPTTRPSIEATLVETAPAGFASKSVFYPLQVGNRWVHRGEEAVRIVPNDGDGPPVFTPVSETQREMLCVQSFDGVPYVAERATEYVPNGTFSNWTFYRQDTAGLYERDALGTDPPPCPGPAAPGADQGARPAPLDEKRIAGLLAKRSAAEQEAFGVALRRLRERVIVFDRIRSAGLGATLATRLPLGVRPGELTRLRYPLDRKRRWAVRNDPTLRMTAVVEGPEVLNLPPGRLLGYRIRLEADAFGPRDVVRVWYGRQGYLKLVAHFELDATDAQGQFVGRALFDERETLIDLSLAGGEVAAAPLRPQR